MLAQEIPISSIGPSPFQKRRGYEDGQPFRDFCESIRARGVVQPIVVRKRRLAAGHGFAGRFSDEARRAVGRDFGQGGVAEEWFELVCGERRTVASAVCGLDMIPAVIVEEMADDVARAVVITENADRDDLPALLEAEAVKGLLDALGGNHREVGERLGRTPAWVAMRARLAELSPTWRAQAENADSVVSGWAPEKLELIARMPTEDQEAFWGRAQYGLPVNPTRQWLLDAAKSIARKIGSAPWKPGDAKLLPVAGPCSSCPKTTANAPLLWGEVEVKDDDRCLDRDCWAAKLGAHLAATMVRHPTAVKASVMSGTAGAVSLYSIKIGAKGDEGAVPVVVVDGAEAGKLFWGFPPAATEEGAGAAPAKSGKKTLAEKRARLEVKRQVRFVELTVRAMREHDPDLRLVLVMAAAFGEVALHVAEKGDDEIGLTPRDAFGVAAATLRLEEALLAADNVLRAEVWRRTTAVVADRTKYFGPHQDFAPIHALAERIGEVLGLDRQALVDRAIFELPEPKTWAKEASPGQGQTVETNEERAAGGAEERDTKLPL